MDPNENLYKQRELAARILRCDCFRDCQKCKFDGAELADLVQALDQWIRGGGALPTAWRK